MSLVIVDTGVANLASVAFAFERLGVTANITEAAAAITAADRVVLPGVGAAPYAMQSLTDKGLVPVLRGLTQPVLGICLGMQLLFETLEEGGTQTQGLGLISGGVSLLDTQGLPSPHMGWNQLETLKNDPLLAGLEIGSYAYFVHSFAAPVSETTLMQSTYGTPFSAIVRQDNVWGCQFHPERSSTVGAQILSNFLKVPS